MAEYDLTGRNVIMTGAGRGLGLAMTQSLTEAGANVLAAAHIADDFPALEASVAGNTGKVHCVVGDIRKSEDCDRIVSEALSAFGSIDGLVNNAGLTFTYIWPDGHKRPEWRERGEMPKFYEATDEVVQNVMDTNFVGGDKLGADFGIEDREQDFIDTVVKLVRRGGPADEVLDERFRDA